MGHRALLAYRRDATDAADHDATARYDLHRSHWGGADFALARQITADAPFASDTRYAVDPDPVATDLPLAEIVTHSVDYLHHEAFYRVGTDHAVTPFHVCWFGLELDSEHVTGSPTVGHGALVEGRPDDATDGVHLQGWVRGTKGTLGHLLDQGALDRRAALDALARRLDGWTDDREVVRPD